MNRKRSPGITMMIIDGQRMVIRPRSFSILCCTQPRPTEGPTGCGWDASQTFVCATCKREVCYCQGCFLDDGHDDDCDECWAAHQEASNATG